MRIETIGNATLYLGDCREVLPTLAPCDLILTDPPYGIKRFEKGFGTTRFKGHGAEKTGIEWDRKPELGLLLGLIDRCRVTIIWGANNFGLPPHEHFLVWDKMQTVENFASAEYAYYNGTKPAKVFRYSIHQHNQDEKNKAHPTQKPVRLMEWCISQSGEVTTVCDPFMGSGTTGVAAVKMGRTFIGIEREPKYFDIAYKRIEDAQRQTSMFEQPAMKAEQHAFAL
jgi:site-specific DNA-methyltransferase (adenine-specific)/modification methylase